MKSYQRILFWAGLSGALAVVLGAFGAHTLSNVASFKPSIYQTGIQYHFYHTLALFGIGIWQSLLEDNKWTKLAALFIGLGILLFSGSLYLLATRELLQLEAYTAILGPITPIGGLCFIIGWICITIAATKDE